MSKVDSLLKRIDSIIKATDEDITEKVSDFPGLDKIPSYIEDYEKKLAKCLRDEKKHFVKGIESFISKDELTLEAIYNFVTQDLFAADVLSEEVEEITKEFLELTIAELCFEIMDAIDTDVGFKVFSSKTVEWINSWAEELGKLMKLNSHKALQNELIEVLEKGESIEKAVKRIKDLPQFNRNRARTTAITEILTASSRAQWESYMQSPAVKGKKWKHSGGKKINPREAHVDMDGTVIGIDEKFDVNGYEADYPRDPALPASERVNCHCAMGPDIDTSILELSKEEKEELRMQALEELGGE